MHDQPTSSLPDPRVVELVLSALDEGVPADIEALRRAVHAPDTEIRTVLEAVRSYRNSVASERAHRGSPPIEDEALPPGTRIGDFVVESMLGCGAMGVVYRARQASLGGRVVALKVLPKALIARDARFADRFRREAELASKIHHPNLAEVYGFETTTEAVCFAMRLVEGRTLQDVLVSLAERNPGPLRSTSAEHVHQCVLLVRALADALAAIHSQRLVHRDVKPSNIILEGAGSDADAALAAPPVLVDFGLLRPAGDSELTGTRTSLGTPAYASPEGQLGRGLDGRTDVFSLGATLYDLVTLTAPSARSPATAGLPDARLVNPAVDARLAAILAMALQEKRELRYEDGGAFRDELDRYLRGEPIRALPVSALGRLRLWVRRNPFRALRVGAVSFVGATMLVVLGSIGAWTLGLTRLARDAMRMEREGDLLGAARALRELSNEPNAALLPWLGDDLQHVGWYWDEGGPLSEVAQHLFAGEAALPGRDESESVAEGEFARANDRLCELLFSEHAPLLGDPIRRFLMREVRDGAPEFRQRLAMGTWANYLIVQEAAPEKGQIVPEGLVELLRSRILGRADRPTEAATRQSAVAALGAIRDRHVFEVLVGLLHDEDEEVARLAYTCSYYVFRWLHLTAPKICQQFKGELMAAWGEGVAELSRRRNDPGLPWPVVEHIAWWERNPELPESEAVARHLQLSAGVRQQVDAAHRWLAAEWAESAVEILAIDNPTEGCKHWEYLVVSGRALNQHEAGIWKDESGTGFNGALGSRSREDAGEERSFGRIEFLPQMDGSVRAVLSGTVIAADRKQASLMPWPDRPDRLGYLRLDRPGRSQLRVATLVPRGAEGLQIRVKHMMGTRPVLPRRGHVAFRLRLDGLPCEFTSRASGGDLRVHAADTDSMRVSPHHLLGRDELQVVLDYLNGNTTYRVLQVEFVWDLSTPK